MSLKIALLASVSFALIIGGVSLACERNECEGSGTSILIDSDDSKLFLCKSGKEVGNFRVSFGRGGFGKTKQGDKKTPLGAYSLGNPRPSGSGFKTFIPVGYPTKSQRAKGYTGGAIGIHGPAREFKFLGPINSTVDWTQGCIAVATDNEIDVISSWVSENSVSRVVIQ